MDSILGLSLLIFMPTIGALALALLFNSKAVEAMRVFTVVITAITFVMTLLLWSKFDVIDPGIQPAVDGVRGVSAEWIGSWNIHYRL